ncbi:unnamed protein product [Closterium sp. NIES-54]
MGAGGRAAQRCLQHHGSQRQAFPHIGRRGAGGRAAAEQQHGSQHQSTPVNSSPRHRCHRCHYGTVQLASFNFFHHGKSCTVWLQQTPSLPLIALQRTLEAAFPECNVFSQIVADRFCPHLSIGQWRTRKEAEAAITTFHEKWTPITFQLTCVSLISRQCMPFLIFGLLFQS